MNLTEEQLAAVQSESKRTAVIAGAGTGKTATIVGRYQHMLKTIPPSKIVIVTFTVAAANELKRRLEVGLLPAPGYVGTIHGWCAGVMPPDVAVAPESVAKMAEEMATELITGESFPDPEEIASGEALKSRVYNFYTQYLARNSLMDYDMMLRYALRESPNPIDLHLIVDEYQDTGPVERQIYDKFMSVFAVADPRQTLYGWRGAAGFDPVQMNAWKVYDITRSYRVPGEIANVVNRIRFDGVLPLVSVNSGGEFSVGDVERWIVDNALISGTVLCRSNREVTQYTDQLKDNGVPVRHAQPPCPALVQYADWLAAKLNPKNDAIIETFIRRWTPLHAQVIEDAKNAMVGVASVAEIGEPHESLLQHPAVDEMIRLYQDDSERLLAIYNLRYTIAEGAGFLVTTIHQAKGLEWDNVCLILPQWFKETEENKRLLYVAMTRAKKRLCIDPAKNRVVPKWIGL